ncbi:GntR family transcriptional regulator [Deinococcus psychrotolerans]|uniref:GntR family transcriptional regulator n=1 Tax=Deinococcus psychrotolerans TaxID=2489213 RepID=A0A3G8YK47_9DEIO|nr:GntR family transcriptional regulator [Deinococcus psychrotolerans]AZI41426.1 GntR family transcriptional regulator [Deinococcus psychrotolerans]
MTLPLSNKPAFERPALVREGVYLHLREAILGGEFLPGERLGEVELGARLGVSRTPIREALMRLTQDGLIETEANKGVRVRQLSRQEIAETYVVRAELDGLAAALAAEQHDLNDAAALRLALAQLSSAKPSNYREQTLLDLAFHCRVAQAAHNAVLFALCRDLEVRVSLIKHQTRTFNAYPRTHDQHAAILEAVLSRNPEAARAAAQQHVRTFAALVMDELQTLQLPSAQPQTQGTPSGATL